MSAVIESVPVAAPAVRDRDLPDKIGPYRVLGRLGEGATSEVFHCRDEFRDRDVAVKRLRPQTAHSDDARFSEAFFAAEAALVGRLQHPNIVQLYDAVGVASDPYLVMELVAGTTLRPFCNPGSLLALEQVVEVGFKCAMALAYVTRQGLIHRDVKPANILAVVKGDEVVDVKLTDFGSVLNLSSERTQIHRVGSLLYMSPEQLEGGELDCRADIYSLAAVLYHLVAGRPPFDAPHQGALLNQICHAEPPPLTDAREGVSPAFDAVIRKALAKQPQDRYASWDEFGQQLSALVTNREVPRGSIQRVLDSERFNLLRTLEFFRGFGDTELWEVVHRARWLRFPFGTKIYKRGQEGRTFHIIAQGQIEVFRDGQRVAKLGAGTSVGEMAYLAPSPELRKHSTDVVVAEPSTTISFTPDTLSQLSMNTRHLFDAAFIGVLVRRLHAAHEALAHPRRIL
jgi:eukaryotic-like serine/threonine-protein kinase